MANVPYRKAVGMLNWLAMMTRPDIAYATSVVCRFAANPGKAHWNAVKRIIRYLRGTDNLALKMRVSRIPPDHDANPWDLYMNDPKNKDPKRGLWRE